MNIRKKTLKLVWSAFFLALGYVLPFVTMQIPTIGKMLCPMHIPIMLCGIFCGWPYALIIGIICPILRSFTTGMPAMIPSAISMAFELPAYGISIALLFNVFKRKKWAIFPSLIISMLCGRIVWGLVRFVMAMAFGINFSVKIFLAEGFVRAFPGIIAQLIIVPAVVLALWKVVRAENLDNK